MTLRGRGSSGKGCSGWLSTGGAPRRARACRAMATGRRSGYTSAGAGRAIGSRCPTFGWRTCPLLSSVLSSSAGRSCTRGSAGRSAGTPRGARSDSRDRAHVTDQLRVAMLAPISWRVPPRHYGPWEQFVSLLTEGLVERGVDVTLFATADSDNRGAPGGTAPTGYSEDPGLYAKVWEGLHISAVFERADEFDLIHNSFDFLPLTYSDLVDTPVITTIHGFSSEQIVPVFEKYNAARLLRRDQRFRPARAPRLRGDDSPRHRHARVRAGVGPGDYLLFFGRIHPEKGTARGDRRCREGRPAADHRRDHPGPGVLRAVRRTAARRRSRSLRRPVGPDRRGELLAGARALLHLVNFDEPFGFSVVEAMACGTPVIARPRGSMPEMSATV